jgi:hypothetical protein
MEHEFSRAEDGELRQELHHRFMMLSRPISRTLAALQPDRSQFSFDIFVQ